MKHLALLCLLLVSIPSVANAWWNDQWSFRKKITLDTTISGVELAESLKDYPVLIRLHAGNFKYFLDLKADASDLRFMSADDKIPLKYHVEKFDPINEIALIWVKIPQLTAKINTDHIWMYYGNQNAVNGTDPAGTYDSNYVTVLSFKEGQSLPVDKSSFSLKVKDSTATVKAASLIGAGLQFDGSNNLKFEQSPVLKVNQQQGYSFSAWVRSPGIAKDSVIYSISDKNIEFILGHDQNGLYLLANKDGITLSEVRSRPLLTSVWQHIAFTLGNNEAKLFVDGIEVGKASISIQELDGSHTIGSSNENDRFLIAELDEIRISNILRSPIWIYASAKTEGQTSKLLSYAADESAESSESSSYFGIILKNVTIDGWAVIFILIIMLVISFMVMFMKWLLLQRVGKDSNAFLEEYRKLGNGDPAQLDMNESADEAELQNSPITAALYGKHDHFQSSPLYHIYHRGIQEVQARLGKAAGAQVNPEERYLTVQSLDAIRANLDAAVVRESQKLNNLMVLLTISISGGPFLGLLGTVVGVMITFAAIAAAGDVNINAIAPGISAALLATVAGLAVAIPALFGYNYLGSKIKDSIADMHVFVDEFITRLGEYYSK